MPDSLKIHVNEDNSISLEWDKEDPNWKWLNGLTSKEIQDIIQGALTLDENDDQR